MSGKKKTSTSENDLTFNEAGREFLLIMNREAATETRNLVCLNLAAYTYQEWRSAVADVKRHGRYCTNRNGEVRKSAYAQREAELRNSLLIFLRELKATTATSAKLLASANTPKPSNAPALIDGDIGKPL